jgi:hypothetical protein
MCPHTQGHYIPTECELGLSSGFPGREEEHCTCPEGCGNHASGLFVMGVSRVRACLPTKDAA